MGNSIKRFLSLALAIVMILSIIPTNARAEGTDVPADESTQAPVENVDQTSENDGDATGEENIELVAETTNVAKIGDEEYTSLQAAMKACVAGENIITLLADSAEVFSFSQGNGVNITIDGDGHTFSGKITLNAGGGNLTFTDAKIAPAKDQTIYLNASTAPNITFVDCTLQGVNMSGAIVYGQASNTDNSITVNNCLADNLMYIVSIRQTGPNSVWIEDVTATNMGYLARTLKCPAVTIKNVTCDAVFGVEIKNDGEGGRLTLENVNINVYTYPGAPSPIPVSGIGLGKSWTVTLNGVNQFSVNGVSYEDTTWLSGNNGYKKDIEAQNGSKFGSLEAIAADAKPGETVKLLKNNDATFALPEGVELDKNGFKADGVTETKPAVTTKAELDAAIAAAEDGDVIKLANDLTYDGSRINIDKAITLDLNGNTITTNGSYGVIKADGGCSIINGKIVYTGTNAVIKVWNANTIEGLVIEATNTSGATIGGIVIQEGSTVRVDSIKNVTIKGAGLTNGIQTYNCGTAKENVIGSMENVNIDAVGVAMNIYAPCGTATNCTFKGGNYGIEIWIKGTYNATLDLVNCTVEGGGDYDVFAHDEFKDHVTNNGTLTLTADAATGLKNSRVNTVVLHESNIAVKNEGAAEATTFRLFYTNRVTYVATIGETGYTTLAAALSAAQAGDTITLLADNAEEFEFAQNGGKITIDGNGNKFTGVITLSGSGELTFTNMTIVAPAGKNGATVVLKTTNSAPDIVFDECVLTLEGTMNYTSIVWADVDTNSNVVFSGCTASNLSYLVNVDQTGFASITVEDTTATGMASLLKSSKCTNIVIKNVTCEATTIFQVKSSNKTTLALEDVNFKVTGDYPVVLMFAPDSGVGALYTITLNGVNTYVDKNGVAFTSENFVLTQDAARCPYEIIDNTKTFVAQIGTQGYATVEEAFAAAKNGETVELIADTYEDIVIPAEFTGTLAIGTCTINSITNNSANATIVINGDVVVENANGSAITGEVINISGNGTLTAIANGDHAYGIGGDNTKSITIENVHILKVQGGHYGEIGTDTKYYKDAPEGGAAIGSGSNGAVITLTNVTIDKALGGSKAAGIGAEYHTGVTINITGCEITYVEGGATAAAIGGSRVSNGATDAEKITINIKNSTITAVGGVYAAGIGSGYDTYCQANQPICTINIDGSTINATGGKYAAGVGTGYHNAGMAGEIKNSTITAVSGEKVYKAEYTSAQDIGFGVANLAKEGSNNKSFIIYNGTKISLPGTGVAQVGETQYQTVEEAIAAAENGETVELIADTYEDIVIPAEFGGTLAIGTCKINSITNNSATAKIVINGDVVVENANGSAITGEVINISGNGTLTAIANGDHAYGIGGDNTKSITIENVHILKVQGGRYGEIGTDTKYYKDAPEGGAAIGSGSNGAVITLTNVTIDKALGGSKAAGIGAKYHTGVTINITDCEIDYVEGGATAAGIGGSRVSNGATASEAVTINIQNSTITAVGGVYAAGIGSGYDTYCQANQPICTINIDGSTINATGGKYAAGVGTGYHNAGMAGEIKNSTITAVSGEKVYKAEYTSAQDIGFGVANLAKEGSNNKSFIIYNGTKISLPGTGVAQVGETQYQTVEEAIAAAENGETIVLIDNVTVNQTVVVPAGKTITLDLNGKTISQSKACTASYEMIKNLGNLTITGNGKISFTDTGAGDPSFGWGSYTIRNEGTLVVENGTIEHKGAQAFATHMICAIFQYSGSTTINGGTISTPNYRSVRLWKGDMTINGGTFDGQVWVQAVDNSAELTINGGKFEPNGGDASSVFVSNATYAVAFAVTNGTFNGKIGANDVAKLKGVITGGKFTEAAKNGTNEALLADNADFADEADADGYYGIVPALPGSGTESDPYQIGSVEDLILFRDSVNAGKTKYNASGVYVVLTADIDLASVANWAPIGNWDYSFDANFNGNGHKIKNLKMSDNTTADGEAYLGFFGITANNTIENFVIENVTIESNGQIVAAAIAYPYYTTVNNITVCGDIAIKGGNYTAGVLAYTRLCENASNLAVKGNDGSYITGARVVGGVIADIQMNKGLVANYSNFAASNVTITGDKMVGGIAGIISSQTLNGATVKSVKLVCSDARVGIVSGALGGTSTITNMVVENVTGATAIIGGAYEGGAAVQAKIGDTYYATFDAAYADATTGETITLLAPIVVNAGETLTLDKNVTITYTSDVVGEDMITVRGTLNVASGKITYVNNSNGTNVTVSTISAEPGSVVNVTGGTIENKSIAPSGSSSYAYAIDLLTNGSLGDVTVNISGGTVSSDYVAIRQFNNGDACENILNVTGGNIYGAKRAIQIHFKNNAAHLAISGGEIKADGDYALCFLTTSKNISVSGGSIVGPVWYSGETGFITGGTFDEAVTEAYCAAGYIPVKNSNGTYGVKQGKFVARVNGVGYETLGEAFAAAQDDDTITVLVDIATSEGITNTKKITLDLNGKTITGTDNATGSFGLITNKSELTITGNGTMTLVATNNRGWNAYSSVISNTVGGKLIVKSGTIEHLGGTDMAYAIDNLTNGKGTYAETVIEGGTIKSTYRAIRQFLNGVEAQNILTVNGGTIEGANKSIWMQDPSKNANTGKLTVGANAVLNGDVYLFVTAGSTEWPVSVSIAASAVNGDIITGNVPEGYVVEETNGTWGVRIANYVASVNGVKYESLQAAVNAGGTVTFLADITEDVTVSKAVTIDGADFTFTGKMTLKADTTIKNVNFDGKGYNGYAVETRGAQYLTIEDCTAKNYGYGFVQLASATALTTVKNVTVSNMNYGVKVDYSGAVVLENVDMTAGVAAVLNSNYGEKTVTIKNSKLNILGTWTRNNTIKTTYVFEGDNTVGKFITEAALDNFKLALGATLTAPNAITATATEAGYSVKYVDGKYIVKANMVAIGEETYASLTEALAAANAGDIITFLADITEDVTVSEAVTINGAGKTYTGAMTLKADTTIKNVNFDGKGYNGYAITTRGANYLTIEDCTAKNYGYGFVQLASGTALTTVKNVTISNMNYGVKVDYSNAVVLENVDITAGVAAVLNSNYGEKTITIKNSKLNILGTWTRNSTIKTTYVFEGDNTVGKFITEAALDNFKLAEGATLTAPNDITVTTDVDKMKVTYEDGTYQLIKAAIAKIGSVEYSSLQEAVDAAKPGATITLICDAEGPGVVVNKNININFGGFIYTLTEGVGSTGTESNGFQILKGNKVLLRNGTLKVADSAAGKFYILIQNYADLTVKDMTLDGTNLDKWSKHEDQIANGDSYVISNNSGTVNLNATIITNDEGSKAWAFDVCDKTANGYTLPVVTTSTTTTINGNKIATAAAQAKIEAAVKCGNTYYATLNQAVEAAKDNSGAFVLMRDVAGPGVVINKNFILDFGGHTYTLTEGVGSTGTATNGFQILKGNAVTLRNGTLKVADSAADKFYILIQNYADLTVNNMTLDGTNLDKYAFTDYDSYTLSNNSGKVTIGANTKIIANNDGALAFAFDACDKSAWGYELPVVTVHKTAVIEGNIEAAAKIGNVYYATLQQAIDAATNNQTITLMSNIEMNTSDAITCDGLTTMFAFNGKSLTLDMNGKTISVNYDSSTLLYSVIYVGDGASLTVKGDGKINLTTGDTKAGNYDCVAYMFLKRGTTGNLTIENGTFTANKLEDSMVYTNGDKVVNVKDGTWTLANVGTETNGAPWIFNTKGQNASSILVSGGTYNFNVGMQYYAHEVDIVDANGDLGIIVDNGNGTWTVTGETAEAAIMADVWGGYDKAIGYVTLAKALDAAKPGQTVLLMQDIVLEKSVAITGNRNVVIDLHGHTLSSAKAHVVTCYYSKTTITIKDSVGGGEVRTDGNGKHAFVVQSNLVIDGAVIRSTKNGNAIVAQTANANVTIQNDAVINGKVVVKAGKLTVTGGTFNNKLEISDGVEVAISGGYFKYPVEEVWCAEGYIPTGKLENGYYSVMEDPAYGMVAMVTKGETVSYFETLAAAIAAAEDGATVTVLADIDLANETTVLLDNAYNTYFKVEGKSITINLNGKTISGTYTATDMLVGVFSTENNGHLVLTGNGTVALKAIGDDGTVGTVYSLIANYEPGCSIVIENGTYTLDVAKDSLIYSGVTANEGDLSKSGGIVVKGGTFTLGNIGKGPNGNGSPWIFNVLGRNSGHIWVTGGTFNADVNHQYWIHEVQLPETKALKANGDGTWTVVDAAAYVVEIHKGYKHLVGYATVEEAEAAANGWEVVKNSK